jgi:putative ABC transport system permease protein
MSDVSARQPSASLSLATYASMAVRNLLRNSRRTALTLVALIVAMGALTFLMGFVNAYMVAIQENFVLVMNGHVQVYAPGYKDSNLIDDHMPDILPIANHLESLPGVQAWTARITTSGLASVARASTSVGIVGVDPLREPEVSRLARFVSAGEWLASGDDAGILLGDDVAENLEAAIGDKIVVMTQAPGGDIEAQAFRVRGLLHSGIPKIDRFLVLVTLQSAQKWLSLGDGATNIIVRTKDFDSVDPVADTLAASAGDSFDVQRWYTQDLMISTILEFQNVSNFMLIAIVVVVVLGQLINTMFMSLYDRTREFGLMEALGSRRRNLFGMVIAESTILVVVGGVVGYAVAFVAVWITGRTGIDLSHASDMLASFYMDPVIRPSLDLRSSMQVGVTIIVTAILAGLLPAWRATRLNPIDAMRQI